MRVLRQATYINVTENCDFFFSIKKKYYGWKKEKTLVAKYLRLITELQLCLRSSTKSLSTNLPRRKM